MIVPFSYTKTKGLISDFLQRASYVRHPLKDEVTLITNQDKTLINNIFKDFPYNTVGTRRFKDGTFYLVVAMRGSEFFIQIVLDNKICSEDKFQVKRLLDLHAFISDEYPAFDEDEFLKMLDG